MNRTTQRGSLVAAVVVLALALVTLGAGARGPAGVDAHPAPGMLIAIGALVMLGVVCFGVALRRRLAWRRRGRLLAAIAVSFAILVLVGGAIRRLKSDAGLHLPAARATDINGARLGVGRVRPTVPTHDGSSLLSPASTAVGSLILLLLVLAVACLLLARRRAQPAVDAGGARAAVYAALDAADDAMRDVVDPRAAIIACYAAMERVLADGGVRRLAAETPGELLARAAVLNRAPEAAARLTALFLEARYSSHPMSAADRDDAQAALAELRERDDEMSQATP